MEEKKLHRFAEHYPPLLMELGVNSADKVDGYLYLRRLEVNHS